MSSATSSMVRVGPAATAPGGTGTDGTDNNNNNHLGSLRCTILSAYDVPLRDPPSYLEITAGGQTMRTGPPLQRHKDRNSFKFGTSNAMSGSSNSGTSVVVSAATGAPSGNQQQQQQQGSSSSSSSSFAKNNTVCISAPLPVLYQDEVTIKVVYASNPRQNLITSYKLKQLPIRETTWLILTLTNQNMAEIADITNMTTNGGGKQHQQRPPADFGGFGGSGDGGGGDASTTTSIPPPTLRLHMCLDGPYRAEIAALLQVARIWFGFVDSVEHYLTEVLWRHSVRPAADAILGVLPNVRTTVDPKLLLVPAVPFAAAAVVCAPAIAGVLILSLPMLLPIVVVLGALLGAAATAAACLYASTRDGRSRAGRALSPAVHTLLSTPAGQSAVYQTGNRPTPVGLARMLLPSSMWGKLWFSLWVDFMGSASYLLPVAGECADVVWAPFQTVLVAAMYDSVAPALKYLSFAEEILPFTDIVPTATTGWLVEFALPMVKNQWSTARCGGASSETTTNNGDKNSPGSAAATYNAHQSPLMMTTSL